MFKTLPFLLLLAAVRCQDNNGMMTSVLESIFGPSPTGNSQPTEPTINKNDVELCQEDGYIGECVPYFICDRNSTIVDDGDRITNFQRHPATKAGDTRSKRQANQGASYGSCRSDIDTCCIPRSKPSSDNRNKPEPEPNECVLPPYPFHGTYELLTEPKTSFYWPGKKLQSYTLRVSCSPGYVFKDISKAPYVSCINGMLSQSIPECVSATPVPTSSSTDDVSCTLENGAIGECIPFVQCKGTVNHGGIFYTDTRNPGCQKPLHRCCPTDSRRPSTVTQRPTPSPESNSVTVGTGVKEIEYCKLEGGSTGECVSYYLCTNDTKITESGLTLIDIRTDDDKCVSYLDLCCKIEDKRAPENPVVPEMKPTEQRQGCGWRNPMGVGFIITGAFDGEANFAEFPWMVAILTIKPIDDEKPKGERLNLYVCGGSLINPNVVLTAAHCVTKNETYKIRAGEWDTQTTKELYAFQDRNVASVEIHEDYKKGILFFDVALLFLAEPVILAPNVGVVCLPPPGEVTPASTRCFATGWGRDIFGKKGRYQIILKKIELPVVEHDACQTALRTTRLGRRFKLHSSFMCAGGEKDKDTCKGDGGSPLSCPIQLNEGRYVQSGIVAWGIECGAEGIPGVYADVATVRQWIDQQVIAKGYDTKSYTV